MATPQNRLVGRSREQIEQALRDKKRAELLDVIYSLATCEPMLSPREIATRRQMTKRRVMQLIKDGTLRAHKPAENALRVPLSSIREWDQQTALFFSPPMSDKDQRL
jgi:hypothetical protein